VNVKWLAVKQLTIVTESYDQMIRYDAFILLYPVTQ